MAVVLFAAMLIIPYLCGKTVTFITGDKEAEPVSVYLQGLITIFLWFFVILLIALKLDWNLNRLAVISMLPVLAPTFFGLLFALKGKDYKLFVNIGIKDKLFLIIPSAVLGIFSIFFLDCSFANDATPEIVRTTLENGSLYVYSALDGNLMENGLPIFNKISIIPMFYAVLSRIFSVDISVIIGLIMPIFTYFINVVLAYKIIKTVVKGKHVYIFFYAYLLLLVSGTFLPGIAIPVTSGFVLLRQGFTGYTWAYCVVSLFALYLFRRKQAVRGVICLVALIGLVKLDSIYYAFLSFKESYTSIGLSGKLWIFFLCCILYNIYIAVIDKDKFRFEFLLSGSLFIAYTIISVYEKYIEDKPKQRRICFLAWMAIAALASVSFFPFKGAHFTASFDGVPKEVKNSLDFLSSWHESEIPEGRKLTFLAPKEYMYVARRYTSLVSPVYKRNVIEPLLTGYDYENEAEGAKDLVVAIDGIMSDYADYSEDDVYCAIVSNTLLDNIDVIVLPAEANITGTLRITLRNKGFKMSSEEIKVKDGYMYLYR